MMPGEKASPSASAGRIRCWQALRKTSRRPAISESSNRKSGEMRYRQSWRDFAGERQQLQRHAKNEQQDQTPEKFRDRQQQHGSKIGDRLDPGAAHAKQQQPAANAEDRGDHHGAERKLDGRGQGRGHQRSGITAQRDGAAEVAVQRVGQPDQILLRQGLIETHFAALGFDFLDGRIRRQRHRCRIDRQQAEHAEQQRGDNQQYGNRHEQTARDQLEDGSDHFTCHHPPSGPREVARPDDRLHRVIQ